MQDRITQLKQTKRRLYKEVEIRSNEIIAISTKEAQERDKHTKTMLEFLHTVGFDLLSQETTNSIIKRINQYPQHYGLDTMIDFENSKLGYDTDF